MIGWVLCRLGRHDFYRSPWGSSICLRPFCGHSE